MESLEKFFNDNDRGYPRDPRRMAYAKLRKNIQGMDREQLEAFIKANLFIPHSQYKMALGNLIKFLNKQDQMNSLNEVKRFQKIAGLLKEEEDGLSSQNLDRIAGKVKGSGKLKAVYPFENQEKYTWEDFAREVVKQNPDPAGGTPKGGERIYTLEFEDASSVHATFDREDDLKTWEEVVEYYISGIEELYSSVAGFAKVFTWYSWHGPFKDLAGLVYEVTVESRQGIIDTVDGSVGCFILGEANEFIVIDSTWEKGGEMREWEEGDEEKDEEEPYENDMDNLDTSLPR